jgi:outer membrane protein assembly factor BamA
MRFRMARVVVFAMACLLAGNIQIQAQTTAPAVKAEKSCPPSSTSYDKKPSDPEISVAGVTFSGFLRMPVSDQDEIVASIKEQTYGDSLEGVTDGALERVRVGWQNHGYFKVLVNGYATALDSTPAGRRVVLSVHVDEGAQYRLGGIEFKGNRAVLNLEVLRALFPIKDGDIFSRDKIGKGLENLRKAYGELGYINFTAVPDTRFDDGKKLINLEIDMDEGKQFYVSDINILGVDESFWAHQMLQDLLLKPGQIYNGRLVELFLKREDGSVPSDCECNARPLLQLDERAGLVTISFDFGFCLSGR